MTKSRHHKVAVWNIQTNKITVCKSRESAAKRIGSNLAGVRVLSYQETLRVVNGKWVVLKGGKDAMKKYKLDQLKGFLKKYSLNNMGKKNELVDRIIDFVKSTQIKFLDNFLNEDNDSILSSELEDATKKNIK